MHQFRQRAKNFNSSKWQNCKTVKLHFTRNDWNTGVLENSSRTVDLHHIYEVYSIYFFHYLESLFCQENREASKHSTGFIEFGIKAPRRFINIHQLYTWRNIAILWLLFLQVKPSSICSQAAPCKLISSRVFIWSCQLGRPSLCIFLSNSLWMSLNYFLFAENSFYLSMLIIWEQKILFSSAMPTFFVKKIDMGKKKKKKEYLCSLNIKDCINSAPCLSEIWSLMWTGADVTPYK